MNLLWAGLGGKVSELDLPLSCSIGSGFTNAGKGVFLLCICRGCSLSEDGGMLAQRQGLTKEVAELIQEEKKLDELIQSCTLDLKLLTEDSENQRYPFFPKPSKVVSLVVVSHTTGKIPYKAPEISRSWLTKL